MNVSAACSSLTVDINLELLVMSIFCGLIDGRYNFYVEIGILHIKRSFLFSVFYVCPSIFSFID